MSLAAPVVQASDLRYLSERAIRRETGRTAEWVKAHTPLMPGCDYTPTGQRRVPRVCVLTFVQRHDPSDCSACTNSEADAV